MGRVTFRLWRLGPRRWLLSGVVGCVLLLGLWMGAGPADAAGWSIQRLDQPGVALGQLTAVSCSSDTACVAVGVVGTRALAERWDGTSWRVLTMAVPTDSSSLAGVSCSSAVSCVAVGSAYGPSPATALVERWNGSTWTRQRTARVGHARSTRLTGVSCPSARVCVAVGVSEVGSVVHERSLVERWNGSRWQVQSTPQLPHSSGSSLQAVACVSARFCEVVGTSDGGMLSDGGTVERALALRWNGSSWKLQRTRSDPTQEGTTLDGVSCPSVHRCIAVGSAGATGDVGDGPPPQDAVVERWEGSRWALQRVRLAPGVSGERGLAAVSCRSPRACTAVGSAGLGARPLVERFEGNTWTPQSDAAGSTGGELNGVACQKAAVCIAVGGTFAGGVLNTSSAGRTLAEQLTGDAWSVQRAAVTATAAGTLSSVSCTSASACTAVGQSENDAGAVVPVAERWNGLSWSLEVPQDPPQVGVAPPSDGAQLSSVSCVGDTFCMAVGNRMFQGYGDDNAFAEMWDGASWTMLPVPQPTSLPVSLASVSCASVTDCIAVGPVTELAERAMVERWDGTSWVADGSLSSASGLYGVSCPVANDCVAVGVGASAEHWDGMNWTAQSFPQASATAGAQRFVAVSCGSATACVAVDDTDRVTSAWDGSSWNLSEQFVNAQIAFNAVSCPNTGACVAVDGASPTSPASYGWNGSSWSLQANLAAPARTRVWGLSSVSCVSPLTCVAVGAATPPDGPSAMFAERYQ